MNSKTILFLYNRDYSCIERPIPKDSRYSKALSKCTNLQEKLTQLVDKETFSLIEKVLEYQSELFVIEMEEVFTGGFFGCFITVGSDFKGLIYPLPLLFPESF